MAKSRVQSDPLRTKGSHIEKRKGPWKGAKDLPAWFHRLSAKAKERNMKRLARGYDYYGEYHDPVHDSDFYEDLSEIESEGADKEDDLDKDSASEPPARDDCSCNGGDPECGCMDGSEGASVFDDGFGSDMSYDADDVEYYYYELMERRADLKFDRIQVRARKAKKHHSDLEKEEEVRAVYEALKKDHEKGIQTPLNNHITSKSYELFSCDYVEHLYDENFQCTMRLDTDVWDKALLRLVSGMVTTT